MPNVTFDQRSVRLDGKPVPIICGAIHYARSTPGMWPELLRASVEAGINTIDTYVFWGLHEREKRRYDFTGRLDLAYFLSLCQQHKLNVLLRIGPYICAETNFGGLPPWLIHEPGLVTRTDNAAWKREVLTWCKVLMAQIGEFQATRGGPVILAQLENEYNTVAKHYGADGPKYMDWVIASAKEMGLEVPLVMCEAPGDNKLELHDASLPRIIKGMNGFAIADRVPEFQRQFPAAPPIWTEAWGGWYTNFGDVTHFREDADFACAIAHFFAVGGAGVSYYMWHGGTNFGRESVYMQTTTYDSNAPLDEYGLPQRAFAHLKRLNHIVADHAEVLLEGTRSVQVLEAPREKEPLPRAAIYSCAKGTRTLAFLINESGQPYTMKSGALSIALKSKSCAITLDLNGDTRVLFESHPATAEAAIQPPPAAQWAASNVELNFVAFDEPLPDEQPTKFSNAIAMSEPRSMLPHTRDLSDYGWYQTVLSSATDRDATVVLPEVHDFSTLYLNGKFVGSQPERLNEDPKIFAKHTYNVRLKKGENRISILASALGLIKGDWAYNEPMSKERKGVIGAMLVDGMPQSLWWTLHAGLFGERARLFAPDTSDLAAWQAGPLTPRRLRWYRAKFKTPDSLLKARALALDVGALYKGLIWLNGECLGRYWQIPATDYVAEWMRGMTQTYGAGQPVQQRYHIPKDWLRAENTLVVLEETEAFPRGVKLLERAV